MSEETVAAVADRLPPSLSLLALGTSHLRGFSETVRLSQLRHPRLRENFPPLRAIGVVIHNLPFLRASFVGREEEMPALEPRVLAHSLRLTGEAMIRRGDPDAAEPVLDRALAVAQELNAPAEVAGVGC
jgi:hypothetical protein